MSARNIEGVEADPHLRLISFAWEQIDRQESIDFVPGLNLLGERNQSERKQVERTVILRLIRYAMGGSDSRIDDDVREITKSVKLEFLANGKHITTSRNFEHPSGKFPVSVEGRPDLHLSPNEMGGFLLEILEVPKVRYQAGESKTIISFNDIARACVVDRDYSYTEILNKMFPEPRIEVVKLLLGLTTQEIANAEEDIREAEAQIKRLNEEIRGVERLLSDFKVRSLIEIQADREELLAQLDKNQSAEASLRNRIRQAASSRTHEVTHQSEGYSDLSKELIDDRARLESIESELSALERQIQEKTDLRAVLANEAQKLERHVSSQYVLSSFSFSRCPRCLRPIEIEMREREDYGACMLCARPLQSEVDFDVDAWKKAVNDANKVVQEADQLISFYKNKKQALTEERNDLQRRLRQLQAELSRQTAAFVSPLVEDLSLLNTQRTELLNKLSKLELEEKHRRYVIQLHDEYLPKLRDKLEKLQDRLRELEFARGRKGEHIEGFLTHFNDFMRRTASAEFKYSSWDDSAYLPKINEQEHYRAMTGFNLAISVLAFHYGLLAMKVKPPRFATAHPGILIVDEPQQQMMGDSHYQQIMKLFAELSHTYSERIQIIVSATNVLGFEGFIQPITSNAVT